jgi:type III restriction enzyme
LIPALFKSLFKIESFSRTESETFELVRNYNSTTQAPPTFKFRTKEHLLAKTDYPEYINTEIKTFHLDAYCNSGPEIQFFRRVLAKESLNKIYFTGMLVHGQSEFKVNYIDPESHTVRNYHPDFLVITRDGKSIIVEIKNEWLIDDPVILAKKEAANRLAANSQFEYEILTTKHFRRIY